MTTIRLLLALALINKWSVRQLDVQKIFSALLSSVKERVFHGANTGFVSTDHEYVCRLKRALTGRKQVPTRRPLLCSRSFLLK